AAKDRTGAHGRGRGVDACEARPRAPPVPGVEHRPLAPRGQGAADGRGEEEAGLVHERQVRGPLPRLPDDPGELVTDPPRHLLVVPLPGLPPRLLAGPAAPPL